MRLLTIVLFLVSATSYAQVSEGRVTFDDTSLQSLRMSIDASADEVEEAWEDFWEDRYDIDIDKLDKDRNSMAFLAEQISLPIIGAKNVNFYSKITETDNRSDVAMAFAFTESDVVTRVSHPESYRAAEAIMIEFRTKFYTNYFDEQMEDIRDDLEDARDDSQDDSRDAQKARKKIAKYEDKIEDYQERIQKMRDEVGDELESSEEKAVRAAQLEAKLRDLEQRRARYLR
ncbi:hypothetical protein [Neolewinella antarctica]|uniref:Vacuolar-type H+-ATPase subunit I/STV1 n=1 Tax=Neolewinella antarctica TaxID=442734 RepID=A0ABX0X750_9BACT|nr:hypothetical protein [Neolewinella antarctica]NJC24693.1 vacuolar-type H+-ATPase subunit I/STV1 [Neolewinella antarctica]